MSTKINRLEEGKIRTHWYADDLLKQCPSKGDKYVIDEELQHTDHLFLGIQKSLNFPEVFQAKCFSGNTFVSLPNLEPTHIGLTLIEVYSQSSTNRAAVDHIQGLFKIIFVIT